MKLNFKIIFHFLGLLILCNGGFMLLSALVSLLYKDGVTMQLFYSGLTVVVVGLLTMVFTRSHQKEMNKRDNELGRILLNIKK